MSSSRIEIANKNFRCHCPLRKRFLKQSETYPLRRFMKAGGLINLNFSKNFLKYC